jgi:hypothetical protein
MRGRDVIGWEYFQNGQFLTLTFLSRPLVTQSFLK